jgi:transposase-like protein
MRRAPAIRLHWEQRRQLLGLASSPNTPRRVALRARIALRASTGALNKEIARELGTTPATAALWRRRFLSHGVAGLTQDAPRPGRPPSIPGPSVEAVLGATRDPGLSRRTGPSVRSLARQLGMSKSSVQRIRTTRRPRSVAQRATKPVEGTLGFLEMVTDLVGLYVNPPGRAVAFSTDERLIAVRPNPAAGGPPAEAPPRNPAAEFRAFLQRTESETPRVFDVHLLVDARLRPIPPEVGQWLSRHPRFHLHFLPPDRAGLTLMDRLIEGFSRRKDRPGVSPGAHRLKNALREHLRRNRDPLATFVWTAASGEIRGAFGRRDIK